MFSSSDGVVINNEVNCPNDKYIKKFLWSSYFHDSSIINIKYKQDKKTLMMQIESSHDIDHDEALNKFNGNRKAIKSYVNKNKNKYRYILEFSGCEYFEQQVSDLGWEYIFGYFKDSARLKINKKSKNKLYHYRIIISGGYIDIIFSKFTIKKMQGEISIKNSKIKNIKDSWLNDFLEKYKSCILSNGEVNVRKAKDKLESGNEWEKGCMLHYFTYYTQKPVLKYAKVILESDWDEFDISRSCAINAIGMQGDEADIPLLLKEYVNIEKKCIQDELSRGVATLTKRHVMDAIEMVNLRNM